MNKKYILGVIGGGNMANAIVSGILSSKNIEPEKIIICDIDIEKLKYYQNYNINITTDMNELANNCEFLIFAVKPQIFNQLDLADKIEENTNIISIMAGIKIESIRKKLNGNYSVCRVMPNTPSLVLKGMSVLCYENYENTSKKLVDSIFSSIGEISHLEENDFDAVTSISGSGPAYVYMFIDSLIKAGINGGLSEEISRKLAVNTVIGAGTLVKKYEEKPLDELINAVCSKGGTTIEAVKNFRENDLEGVVNSAVTACRLRSEELSKN